MQRRLVALAVLPACLCLAQATSKGDQVAAPGKTAPASKPAKRVAFPRFLRPLPTDGANDLDRSASRSWERSLLLTFDDGPDLVGTSLLLDELTRRGVKAVFFVNGHHIVRNLPEDIARRDLLRKLATHGHLVGNHTMNHKNLCQQRDAIPAEIDGASEIIAYATSVRPLVFRSPYGARCRDLDRALADRDVIQIGWNMDPQEWRGEDEDAIVKYATDGLRRAKGPVILLLHDKNVAAVHALSRILDFVDAENARAAADGKQPIRLVDYRVFLPREPLRETGLEPWARSFVSALGALSSLSALAAP
jgi:peptidoglycan/xylan/chitin deacetylase (PgdA/CDA1 family)